MAAKAALCPAQSKTTYIVCYIFVTIQDSRPQTACYTGYMLLARHMSVACSELLCYII